MKQLGFDVPCLGYYAGDILCTGQPQEIHLDEDGNYKKSKTESFPIIAAPTFSQAFRWFREKYNIHIRIEKYDETKWWANWGSWTSEVYDSYEEAELACLKKLIEIVEQKEK